MGKYLYKIIFYGCSTNAFIVDFEEVLLVII